MERQPKRNPNILADLSANNISMVNDGQGGFCPAQSFQEVIDYGDQREALVYRKINDEASPRPRLWRFPEEHVHPGAIPA